MPVESTATVGLAAIAAQTLYRLDSQKPAKDENDLNSELQSEMVRNGYTLRAGINPGFYLEDTPFSIAFFSSEAPDPLILSFKSKGNLGENAQLEAFRYYESIKELYPGRKILLTGEHLGGQLAQLVGARAYNPQWGEPAENFEVTVRTFNTRVAAQEVSDLLQANPSLSSQFINYQPNSLSTQPDYPGQNFNLQKNTEHPHTPILADSLPQAIKSQKIGFDKKAILLEGINGFHQHYRAKIADQIFSSLRAGSNNVRMIDTYLPAVTQALQENNHGRALSLLYKLDLKISGKESHAFVTNLIADIHSLSNEFQQQRKSQTTKRITEAEHDILSKGPTYREKLKEMKHDIPTPEESPDSGNDTFSGPGK